MIPAPCCRRCAERRRQSGRRRVARGLAPTDAHVAASWLALARDELSFGESIGAHRASYPPPGPPPRTLGRVLRRNRPYSTARNARCCATTSAPQTAHDARRSGVRRDRRPDACQWLLRGLLDGRCRARAPAPSTGIVFGDVFAWAGKYRATELARGKLGFRLASTIDVADDPACHRQRPYRRGQGQATPTTTPRLGVRTRPGSTPTTTRCTRSAKATGAPGPCCCTPSRPCCGRTLDPRCTSAAPSGMPAAARQHAAARARRPCQPPALPAAAWGGPWILASRRALTWLAGVGNRVVQ